VSQLVPRANVVAPIAAAVVVTPEATILALDATIESHALSHVFGAAVPVFPFPEDRHRALCHCHWRYWLHCIVHPVDF